MGQFCSTMCRDDEDGDDQQMGGVGYDRSPLIGNINTASITSPGGKSRTSSLGDGVGYQSHETGFVENERGLQLFWQKFTPLSTKPSALVLFLHGIHEHSARYDHVFEQLAVRLDCMVVSFDHQSHGRSDDVRGLRGACNCFEDFIDDAKLILDTFRAQDNLKNLPVYVWGQSFGGLVAIYLTLRDNTDIKGLILSSPAIGIEWSITQRIQARAATVASVVTPDLPIFPTVCPEDMINDPDAVKDYVNDPLNTMGNLRCRLFAETITAFTDIKDRHGELDMKNLLVLFGDKDRCYSLPSAREFVKDVPVKNKELKVFENMYHTLFHGPEQQKVIDHLVSFIEKTNA